MNNTQTRESPPGRAGFWLVFDKLGAVGAIISAVASPCCFPLFSAMAGVLGLGAVPFLRGNGPILIQTMTALALVGQIAAYRRHRRKGPMFTSIASVGLVLIAYFVSYQVLLIYGALAGLTVAAVWNLVISRRARPIMLESVLTCPHCGKQSREVMPTDACLFFWDCPGCGARLKPKPGHCCVFCTYGSVKCPPIQAGSSCRPCDCDS